MKRIQFFIFVLSIFFTGVLQAQTALQVRVTSFPPQYYKNEKKAWTGLDVELAKAWIKEAGFKSEFVELPWARALKELKNGNLHIMMNLSITKERMEFLHFVGPERSSEYALIVRKGDEKFQIKEVKDLYTVCQKENINFGIQVGARYSPELSKKLKEDEGFRNCFDEVPTADLNIEKLLKGRILGFFEGKISMQYRIKTDPKFSSFAIHSYIVHREPTFFGVSKAGVSVEMINKLHIAYENLVKKGTFDQIRNQEW